MYMLTHIHRLAGMLAMLLIATFWITSLLADFLATYPQQQSIRSLILAGVGVLIPTLMITALSGKKRLHKRPLNDLLKRKQQRMKWIASNGLLLLLPCAIFLNWRIQISTPDLLFQLVQTLELLAGAVNLTLLGLNARDGMRLRHGYSKPDAGADVQLRE
jgi:uncharacterized membrane protein